jgi:hypothetical protein
MYFHQLLQHHGCHSLISLCVKEPLKHVAPVLHLKPRFLSSSSTFFHGGPTDDYRVPVPSILRHHRCTTLTRSRLSLPRYSNYSSSTPPRRTFSSVHRLKFNAMVEPLNNRTAPTERVADNSMERPALDDRSYRVIRLPNQLEALLIHDPDTDKASGALDVNVGSFSDKDDMPGLAHAVEHMLFMGTEKV